MATRKQKPIRQRRGRQRRRRGAIIVEMAFILPFFLLFLLGIMDYSRYVMLLQLVNNAAREGARYAVTHTSAVTISGTTYGNADSDVTNKINNMLAGQALSGQSISIYESDQLGNNIGTWQNAQWGNWITVKITGNFNSVLPNFLHFGGALPVTAEACMRAED